MKKKLLLSSIAVALSAQVAALPALAADATPSQSAVNVGEVDKGTSTQQETRKKHLVNINSPVASVHINTDKIEEDIPPGGSMLEAIARNAPGFQARRTGTPSGANRYQIRINGIQIGFDETGQAEMNGNQVLLDGVPLNNPLASYHGFSSAELPIAQMFSGIGLTYGPGTAKQHWFDAMGGTIDFQTKSSGEKPGAFLNLGGGSFDAFNASTGISTGSVDGWRTFISAGYTRTGQARVSPELTGPSQSTAVFIKTQKKLANGRFSVGFYFNNTNENRPHLIPVFPFSGGSIYGNGVPGPLLSQVTSGFYYTPSANLWRKHEKYITYLGYLKYDTNLATNVTFNNTVWYRAGHRVKVRIDAYPMVSKLNTEYYPTSSGNFGDRADFDVKVPFNKISFGGYFIQTNYDSSFAGYDSFVPELSLGSGQPVYFRDDHDHWSAASAYLQDDITPTSWLKIVPGVNLINYHISVNNVTSEAASQLYPGDISGDFPSVPGDSKDFTRLAPSLAISGKINENAMLFADWSQNYQTQIDSAYGEGASHPVIAPNAPARINFYMAGAKYAKGPIAAQVSFVHQKLTDLAVQTTQAESQNIIVEPASETINGVNALVQYNPNFGFNGRLVASILHASEDTVNASGNPVIGARVTGMPTYNLTAAVGYRWYYADTLWSGRLLDSYQSATYLSSDITASPTTLELPYSATNLVNVSLSATTTALDRDIPGLKTAKISLMLDNLLNRKYNVQGYVSAGGNYGPGSEGAILASPGTPRAVYAEFTAGF